MLFSVNVILLPCLSSQCLEEEVAQLSREVEVGGGPSMVAIQLCRRGALLRKVRTYLS